MKERLRIVVGGYIGLLPAGGVTWDYVQYPAGLAALGHDVYFVEDSDDYPSCYDPARGVVDVDPSYGLRFAARAFGRLGLGERWCYGLLAFETLDDVLAGMEEIDGDYERHCRAARELAEGFFDAREVLTSLVERALGGR
jgi:hypothetical protein